MKDHLKCDDNMARHMDEKKLQLYLCNLSSLLDGFCPANASKEQRYR